MIEQEEKGNKKDIERRIIFLLLKNKALVESFIRESLSQDFFSEEHKFLVFNIMDTFRSHDVLLTFETFQEKVKTLLSPKDRVSQELAYSKCSSYYTEVDDFPLLVEKLYDEFLKNALDNSLSNLNNNVRKKPTVETITSLMSDLETVIKRTKLRHSYAESFYNDISVLATKNIQYIEDVKSGKIVEEPQLLTGIDEIDETMVTGLDKGTLTLFCADVGGFKSTMLANIALNVFLGGHNVLMVPLEMDKDQMWNRIYSRECRIPMNRLFGKKKNITDEDLDKMKKKNKEWETYKGKFYIMQEFGRIPVRVIRQRIEENIDIFRPRLVVVDYIANLEADRRREGRNDLEIGDMLKELREMGKMLNFAVISAAQLGRDALKRIRKAGNSKEKAQINSEDIRGSHEYSADADNIYALMRHPHEFNSKVDLFCVKARNGKSSFKDGTIKATLCIQPEFSYIYTDRYGAGGATEEDKHDFEFLNKKDDETKKDGQDKNIEDLIHQQEMDERKDRIVDSEFTNKKDESDASKKVAETIPENKVDDGGWTW